MDISSCKKLDTISPRYAAVVSTERNPVATFHDDFSRTMTTLQLAQTAKQLGFAQNPPRLYRSIIK